METSSPFKVPVRVKNSARLSVCVCGLGRVRGGHVHGPGIDEMVKTVFLLRFLEPPDGLINASNLHSN